MSDTDYLVVLEALQELSKELTFYVGKGKLVTFLHGEKNDATRRNGMHELPLFGALSGYTDEELGEMIEQTVYKGFVVQEALPQHKFMKILRLVEKGERELQQPRKSRTIGYSYSAITEEDRKLFAAFDFFLKNYNDEQKKAMTMIAERALCIAGAGSGKTTTLTKRIEFLVRYRSVNPAAILAITFTRKARQEMEARLAAAGIDVHVETFNSFCEKLLQKHNDKAYDKQVRVINTTERLQLLQQALHAGGLTVQQALELYYENSSKTDAELFYNFLNDCFTIIEHMKHHRIAWDNDQLSVREQASVQMMKKICTELQQRMKSNGLRDYADQIVDALALFEKHPELIPRYDHVLVDEYQDVNALQIKLLDMIAPPHLFCVGDPRQSIFGWRGSDVSFILDFQKKNENVAIVALRDNYRSCTGIVSLMNAAIAPMKLPALQAVNDGKGTVQLMECVNEIAEHDFVVQKILKSGVQRHMIFVLARTHRQLKELSERMKLLGVKHIIRSEETELRAAMADEVVLATVHAIKGMEAHTVFVIGCNVQSFPCRAGDHPVVDLVKDNHYDAFEEERRLFYVALSRAQHELYMTYTGTVTRFVTHEMKKLLEEPRVKVKGDAFERLRSWRAEIARELNVPPYVIFHDSVLLEIATRKPVTLEELQEIKGVGPVKLMKYGMRLLELV